MLVRYSKCGKIHERGFKCKVKVHHITHINKDYDKRIDNLITLCTYHHSLSEHGQITKKELYGLLCKYIV